MVNAPYNMFYGATVGEKERKERFLQYTFLRF